jgi:hypothetical protein
VKTPRRYRTVVVTLPVWKSIRRLFNQGVWVRKITRFEEVLPEDPGYEDADLEEVFLKTAGYKGDFKWLNTGGIEP